MGEKSDNRNSNDGHQNSAWIWKVLIGIFMVFIGIVVILAVTQSYRVSQLQEEIESMQEKRQEDLLIIQSNQKELQELTVGVVDVEKELESVREERDVVEKEVEILKADMVVVREEIKEVEEKITEMHFRIEEKITEVDLGMKEEIDKLESRINKIEDELKATKEEKGEVIFELQTRIDEMRKEMDLELINLKEEISSLEDEFDKLDELEYSCTEKIIIVEKGDTLWNLFIKVNDEVPTWSELKEIAKSNGLEYEVYDDELVVYVYPQQIIFL